MDRLSALDATFLHVEDDVSHMHLGSIGLFEGPPPGQRELLAAIEAKLHLAPRYRQRVRFVPLGAGRPVWADDPHFRCAYHVRRTALPAPGGDAELQRLVGRVMSQQLDRGRPLWELWAVEGLTGGRWALISKLHHSMVDGVSASSLITEMMDRRRDAAVRAPAPWRPAPEPGGAALVAGALAERASRPLHRTLAAAGALRSPGAVAAHAAQTLQGLAAYAGIVRPPPATELNGPIGRHRRWDWARVRLSDVREIRLAYGGTVNDVGRAVIAHGYRALLEQRGEQASSGTIRTLVPVSVRPPGDTGAYNRVSALFADLPVGIADPVARLAAIQAQLRHLKESNEAVAGEALTSLAGFAPELLLALSARLATRTPQRNVNTVTTNVPGPQVPLYLAGRRMLETFPYVPIAGHVRIGVAIYSYDGGLGFGVTGDDETAPDIGVLCAGIEHGRDALLAAAHGAGVRGRRTRRVRRAGVRP
ncbi:MAG: WS/DGAT/MGAT family O-acyltransferase [Solirubrobacteraceae bacterium]